MKRITFGIISHPDAGKTTLTEKLLLFGGAIQMAGSIKGRKAERHATSDWLAMEQQRGISVTTSVMQFPYAGKLLNLLDTPGHADFSEDTYRTLTAVDTALMVIDIAKGVEPRTIKLMEICRMRTTPIISFINKLDREGREAIEVLDEIESILNINCAPITWPIGMGKRFQGIYHLYEDKTYLYHAGQNSKQEDIEIIDGIDNPELEAKIGAEAKEELLTDIELVQGASHSFDLAEFRAGKLTPVYFGSALTNFGVRELLNGFINYAPEPQARETTSRTVNPDEAKFSGFVFKIQANMDPNHRDRIAFMRICSGKFNKGMKLLQTRTSKTVALNKAHTFMAGNREQVEEAYPGDIIGIHNHGSIQIGDSFTEGEQLKFIGIPYFAPELFKSVRAKDPLKTKALNKGLTQLSEEGATQVFRPLNNNNIILGAIGVLQFDVVAHRLKHEYNVDCVYEPIQVATARWLSSADDKAIAKLKASAGNNVALDGADNLTYLAPSMVNLQLTEERYPEITFRDTREH